MTIRDFARTVILRLGGRSFLQQRLFRRELTEFRRLSDASQQPRLTIDEIQPHMNDATTENWFDRHYIYHTGWAARVLADTKPASHVDVGSSLYFVGIASATTRIEHLDYRPPHIEGLSGVTVSHANLTALPFENNSIQSLSCMHVLEHVGLGRYGDPIDPEGDLKAMKELQRVLAPGGRLLFVVPVGRPRVVFNAHRVYSFETVVESFPQLRLKEFSLIPDNLESGGLIRNADPSDVPSQEYACGCFLFERA